MKNFSSIKPLFILTTIALAALVLSGCYRQSINSTPPGNKPVKVVADAPAPEKAQPGNAPMEEMTFGEETATAETKAAVEAKTEEVTEEVVAKQVIIEETYEVDAAKEDFNRIEEPKETDLDAEPVAATTAIAATPAEVEAAPETPTEAIAEPVELPEPIEELEPVEVAAVTPAYYIQVGAFSDADAANGVLEALKSKGYADSRISTTSSGLVKVQAGTFADKTEARAALDIIATQYKDAFILKHTP